jgi:hypothetical protein
MITATIERLDHICEAIPVGPLLCNFLLIRDQILLQAFDHLLCILNFLGRGNLELLQVFLIILDVIEHKQVVLLERLEDLKEILFGER